MIVLKPRMGYCVIVQAKRGWQPLIFTGKTVVNLSALHKEVRKQIRSYIKSGELRICKD